jgi:hypothetical protein
MPDLQVSARRTILPGEEDEAFAVLPRIDGDRKGDDDA